MQIVEIFGIYHFHILSNENKHLNPWTILYFSSQFSNFCIVVLYVLLCPSDGKQ